MAELTGRQIKAATLHEKSENASFTGKLKNRAETLFWKSAKCKDQGNLIPKIAGKAEKIKGDKLPENHWMAEAHQFLIEWEFPLLQWPRSPFLGNKEMSWTNFSKREKYVSLRRTTSVLFIGLMAWPPCYHFKPRSAGEVKAFKYLASRKGILSLREYTRS